jgi:spermidine synthase
VESDALPQSTFSLVGDKRPVIELVAISFLSLFLELSLIRYTNSNVQTMAYFNNLLVLSSFLGLGLGSILADRKYNLFLKFPFVFASIIASITILGIFGSTTDQSENVIWVGINTAGPNIPAYLVVILVFCCNCLFFVPLGFRLGQSFNKFTNRLTAYAFDLLGSILGVMSFALLSYFQTAPFVWFIIAGLITVFILEKVTISPRYLSRILFIIIGILIAYNTQAGKWSPYYKVEWASYHAESEHSNKFLGYRIFVDKIRIQDALRFSDALSNNSNLSSWIPYYQLPYHFRRSNNVLILGGGCGNDATIALNNGAGKVDVVEIDPVIINLGYTLHPHKPYLDPRVRTINDDARSFLRKTRKKYDLIVMNALDSHLQLSGLSTLRLESFIYTVEAFEEVKKHMDENSIFVVHLGSTRKWMGERLYWSLTRAFGAEPRLFTTSNSPFGSVAFVYGPKAVLDQDKFPTFEKVISPSVRPFRKARAWTVLATDDWPHLYLSKPQIPKIYIYVLSLIALISFTALAGSGSIHGMQSYLNLFFLGAGFMLLETRAITKIALFFGSTWLVNGIAIGSILAVISIGNLLILGKLRIPLRLCYLGLFTSLAIGYFLPPDFILNLPFLLRILMAGFWFGLPIFFASLVFSYSFRNAENTAIAFGTNLLGIVLGGIFEYGSMVLGLNALYLFAMSLYACAMLFDRKEDTITSTVNI